MIRYHCTSSLPKFINMIYIYTRLRYLFSCYTGDKVYYTGNQSVNQWGPVSSPGSWIARQPASCIPHAGAAMQCWKNDAQTSDFNGVGHDNPRKLDAMSFQTTWCTWCSKASITCAFKAPGHNASTTKTAILSSATSMKTVIDCFKPIQVPFCSSSVFRHILFVNSVLDIRRPLCSARSFMPFFPPHISRLPWPAMAPLRDLAALRCYCTFGPTNGHITEQQDDDSDDNGDNDDDNHENNIRVTYQPMNTNDQSSNYRTLLLIMRMSRKGGLGHENLISMQVIIAVALPGGF